MSIPLAALEEIIDTSGIAPRIELLLPIGVRHRQLRVRTLLAGMMLSQADQRPAHLTRVRDALTALPEPDQVRLGVLEDWRTGPHQLTYRQTERTFGLVTDALAKDVPDGLPSQTLARICDDLLEASIPEEFKDASTSLAVDWTDVETFSRPPSRGSSDCADPEASWGHRSGGGPGQDSELFFGYYASAGTMMREEHGPPVPELARRMTVSSCHHDPARALVPVLTRDARKRASRSATSWPTPATPTATPAPGPSRCAAPGPSWSRTCTPRPRPPRHPRRRHHRQRQPVLPGHPQDAAGTRPAGPRRHPGAGRRARPADRRDSPATSSATITSDDADGYHRVMCPAVMGKIRCPLRPASMTLDPRPARDPHPARAPPGLLHPADHHRAAGRAAKTRAEARLPLQRRTGKSYARRTGAERTFSTAKDPASNNIARGWTRLMGLTPLMLWLTCLLAVRNQRILTAWDARQADDARRAAAGLPPKTRRRRRKTLTDLATAGTPP